MPQSLEEQIIATGYKRLAAKLHPDRGGTAEQMVALNAAKDHLLRLLAEWEQIKKAVGDEASNWRARHQEYVAAQALPNMYRMAENFGQGFARLIIEHFSGKRRPRCR